ncbi:MAG: hypothetical protein R3B92_00105 [Patescibacteria group bacterium]
MPIFTKTSNILYYFTLLLMVMQLGHFSEHVLQLGALLFTNLPVPYMSPLGMFLSHTFGNTFFSFIGPSVRYQLGMELAHLFGNFSFLLGIVLLFNFRRGANLFRAYKVQAFHVFEHILLTGTTYYLNKPYGFSTLLSISPVNSYFDLKTQLAYRIWWHFIFNVIPTVYVLLEVQKLIKSYSYTPVKNARDFIPLSLPVILGVFSVFILALLSSI